MSGSEETSAANSGSTEPNRRDFVATSVMAGGLISGYGGLAVIAGRFLYPTGNDNVGWRFVAALDEMKVGDSLTFVAPSGTKVVIARQTEGDTSEDFIALSSVCPHLGCQVHWEPHNDRFFCPCHNGVFDPQGNPLEGPPAAAGQQLVRFPLKVEDGLLYIEAPLTSVGQQQVARADSIADDPDQPQRQEA